MPLRRTGLFVGLIAAVAGPGGRADGPVRLADRTDPADPYRVDVRAALAGRLTVPGDSGRPDRVVAVSGGSRVVYDERVLPAADPAADRVMRVYRQAEFARTVGDQRQAADIRPAVRRMVVLRSDGGKKAPFSPDGPLTWNEIDVVRTDLFAPVLAAGLLPADAVAPGAEWAASPAAVADLTDLDPVDGGRLTVGFAGVVTVDGRRLAKLTVSGTVTGQATDGPARHTLTGVGYHDLGANRLAYLNLTGVNELLGPKGEAVGRVEGKFVWSRKPAGPVPELADDALRHLPLSPTADNTLLLYDNPDLGVRFVYPRRWRVGLVRGRQVALDEPGGGGLLISAEPPDRVPTADQFLAETRDYLKGRKWAVGAVDPPARWQDNPARVDRFGLDVDADAGKLRLEYAVAAGPAGGATVAARLPWDARLELRPDVDRVLKSLTVTAPAAGDRR